MEEVVAVNWHTIQNSQTVCSCPLTATHAVPPNNFATNSGKVGHAALGGLHMM